MNRLLQAILTSSAIIFLDRISKAWALYSCHQEYTINQFLSCTVMLNKGISWSFFDSNNSMIHVGLSLIVSILVILLFIYIGNRYAQEKIIVAESAVIAGALSNLYDRLWYGGVIDFIIVHYNEFAWPVFNIADIAIVLGVFYMVWYNAEK